MGSLSVLLELPFSIIEWAHLSSFQPSVDAVKMEGVITDSPCNIAFLISGLITLAFDTRVHDVVPADGTVVDVYIPRPKCYGTPFLDLKDFFNLGFTLSGALIYLTFHLFFL